MTDQAHLYEQRYDSFLQGIAQNLERHVSAQLTGTPNIDRIVARAKDPHSFREKARRTDDGGRAKYKQPLTEIQDLLGTRIIVYYKDCVETVVEIIHRYFRPIEEKELVPEFDWAFGYFGQHLVLALPNDVIPTDVSPDDVPRFFELQIKTLFQHAWSEANHDLDYKAAGELLGDQQRRLAFTAAQAWGADRVFEELRRELAPQG